MKEKSNTIPPIKSHPMVWFTADLHFGHKNVLKHCPKRMELCGAKDENDIEAHDKWLIELWNKTVGKKDEVIIVGDFSFLSTEDTKKLMGKLNGNKILILGNHDKSSERMKNYFNDVTQIKERTFKASNYDFLDENLQIYLCHYPLISWPAKDHGALMVHGHCHGNIDEFNQSSKDLRIDVGLDGKLANYNFVSLEQLYKAMLDKITPHNLLREYTHYIFNELKIGVI